MDLELLISMGPYTTYVWSAYVVTGFGLILVAWLSHRHLRREKARASRRRQMYASTEPRE